MRTNRLFQISVHERHIKTFKTLIKRWEDRASKENNQAYKESAEELKSVLRQLFTSSSSYGGVFQSKEHKELNDLLEEFLKNNE